jgi:hypothetical protein
MVLLPFDNALGSVVKLSFGLRTVWQNTCMNQAAIAGKFWPLPLSSFCSEFPNRRKMGAKWLKWYWAVSGYIWKPFAAKWSVPKA